MRPPPGIANLPLIGEVFARIGWDWARLGLFIAAGLLLLARPTLAQGVGGPGAMRQALRLLPGLALVVVDLFWAGIGSNPTASREQVYPETPGIAYLRGHVGHGRIAPVNQRWSLFAALPFTLPDVLPPNSATVFGLRDVQGYDSLFSGRYKAYANGFALPNRIGQVDSSPIEVGNIVFFQNGVAPALQETAAAYAITIPYDQPGFPRGAVPPVTPLDTGDAGMMVYELPVNPGRARLTPRSPGSGVVWREDSPTRVTLEAETAVPAVLSLMDAALPGWRLDVDGRPTQIEISSDTPISRSLSLPAGHHIASFRYEPASVRMGLYAACAAIGAIALFIAWSLASGMPRAAASLRSN